MSYKKIYPNDAFQVKGIEIAKEKLDGLSLISDNFELLEMTAEPLPIPPDTEPQLNITVKVRVELLINKKVEKRDPPYNGISVG